MVYRKFNAPNVEYNEIDRSQYGLLNDGAAVGTMTFFTGFADKGDDYSPKYFRSLNDFISIYGYPTNEAERYFYNAAQEVFNHGGRIIAAKIPYENDSKDKLPFTVYKLANSLVEVSASEFNGSFEDVDKTITSFFELESLDKDDLSSYVSRNFTRFDRTGLLTYEQYDDVLVGNEKPEKNSMLIVGINRSKYSLDPNLIDLAVNETPNFLGFVPVIVSPMNALAYQKIISCENELENCNCVDSFQTIPNTGLMDVSSYNEETGEIEEKKARTNEVPVSALEDFALPIYSSLDNASISKIATEMFPRIKYESENILDRTYLKQIGIVVFKMAYNPSSKKIDFNPVESFIGSLDREARDPTTGKNIFIDEIVNTQSTTINVFSNFEFKKNVHTASGREYIENTDLERASTILIKNQTMTSLGFFVSQCTKNIDVDSLEKSLDLILDHCKDPLSMPIDIVCDAGVSNIAQYMRTMDYSIFYQPEFNSEYDYLLNQETVKEWMKILHKFDDFAKYTRKDCIFVADGPRQLCLAGNQKIIRKTKPTNTIAKNLIPKIKYLTGLNSSYSAGYCDWFQCVDTTSQTYFWCPPSIKAVGVYLFTDRYANTWDAPAGDNRGKIVDAYDVAFSPTIEEAENFYNQSWNYSISYPLAGIVLEGQKTFQIEKTALDRVNVRRLCLAIKKGIREIARWFKYEAITDMILERFRNQIQEFLQKVQARNGISEFYLKLDRENNTDETIERNEVHATIAIRPIKTAEFIIINSIVVNQSADLEEITQSVFA